MSFGAHVSIAGGIHRAVDRAVDAGCEAMQVFVKANKRWAATPLADDEVVAFRDGIEEHGLRPVFAHASYLLNPASGAPGIRERTVAALAVELDRCRRLGLAGIVLHPGAHGGAGESVGLDRALRALARARARAPGSPPILLESTAGQGTALGSRLEHLAWLVERLPPGSAGVCLDTCHLHAAGYALDSAPSVAATLDEVDAAIGIERVALVHLNDSQGLPGSRRDRHAAIGEGTIGTEGFASLLADPRARSIPGILETPKGEDGEMDRVNLARLRALATGSPIPEEIAPPT